ncbi:beta-ketoacyl-[acyl-carrier-protein] synthase family protein [Kitasatospora sp. NPDC096077]|uniref:beta-ketoacyl-[acyl-carrier-protein] synthase family protein n=1 Tax=Kitasatospora sp. NPDC096077 TaxID=3155544 RepID=UPI0033321F8A
MSVPEIAVTGLGLVTPAGLTVTENWAALRRGRSLAAPDPELGSLPVDFSCQVPPIDADALLGRSRARRLDRFSLFAVLAARQAVADAALAPDDCRGPRVGVVLGVGSNSLATYPAAFGHLDDDRPGLVSPLALPRSVPNMAAAEISIDLGAEGPTFTLASACASGAGALRIARDLLRAGTCDIVLAGGSESGRSRMTAVCFHQMRALSTRRTRPEEASRPFDADRDGFVLGEGAAVLVLERSATAQARGAKSLALLSGCGASSDAHHPFAPRADGRVAARALRSALDDAGCTPADIGQVSAHGTSTRLSDAAEAAALTRAFGGTPPPVTAPKGVIGHCLGAAGAIEAAYTVLALQHQTIPPTANFHRFDGDQELDIVAGTPRATRMTAAISCAFGFGGHNAVTLFTTP